ncbi:hypothetical protein F5X99DRAFT_425846 [Biscogniauxia marginata]|nr:hypothetical protein F5X99DRAFT_425846 [Biscogniauxia marginata]
MSTSSCQQDSQCHLNCPSGEVNRCSATGFGDYAFSACVCQPSSSSPLKSDSSASKPLQSPSPSPLPSPSPSPSPPPSPPRPEAGCIIEDVVVAYHFLVYGIKGWAYDGGNKLKSEEEGCGALTGWKWSSKDLGGEASFLLPILIKSGCVEDAIVSAGGPRISCVL